MSSEEEVKDGFIRSKAQSHAVVKLALAMYPESLITPFTLFMRPQMVKEAEDAGFRRAFRYRPIKEK